MESFAYDSLNEMATITCYFTHELMIDAMENPRSVSFTQFLEDQQARELYT